MQSIHVAIFMWHQWVQCMVFMWHQWDQGVVFMWHQCTEHTYHCHCWYLCAILITICRPLASVWYQEVALDNRY